MILETSGHRSISFHHISPLVYCWFNSPNGLRLLLSLSRSAQHTAETREAPHCEIRRVVTRHETRGKCPVGALNKKLRCQATVTYINSFWAESKYKVLCRICRVVQGSSSCLQNWSKYGFVYGSQKKKKQLMPRWINHWTIQLMGIGQDRRTFGQWISYLKLVAFWLQEKLSVHLSFPPDQPFSRY